MRTIVATAIAVLAFTSAAKAQYKPAVDDGIAASPRVRQMLNERKALPAQTTTEKTSMTCPKCGDVLKTEVDRHAKGAQVLAGKGTKVVASHSCTGCEVTWKVVGEGKAKQSVATHKCTAEVAKNAPCCALK